ncbi:MAG: hypothetical protein ABIJ96_14625 [Elusimicrobiota bacterium]
MPKHDISDIDELEFRYSFKFAGGKKKDFVIRLDEHSLELLREPRGKYPEWTLLDNSQCPSCALTKTQRPRCPVAESIVDIVDYFKEVPSTALAQINISTATRKFAKRAPVSDGISALLGLYMVSSGCPVLDKLRPMARTHLPFATHEETMYRVLSMYMLAQYFHLRDGETPDWEMHGLAALMENIRDVNQHFVGRLQRVCKKDAVLNAMVLLDCFAGITSLALKSRELKQLRRLFAAHLTKNPAAT